MTHPRDDLGAYVLRALEPAEHEAVAAHLRGCAECAAELDRLAGLPPLLAHAEGLEVPPPPAGVEERLLDRVARSRARPARRRLGRLRRPRVRALLATALAGAAAGAGVTALALSGGPGDPPPAYALRLAGTGGATARAALESKGDTTEVHLWVEGLPPGADAVYEVRCERPGWSASAGTFRADARGRAYVVLTTAARLGEYERIRVVRGDENVLTGSLRS